TAPKDCPYPVTDLLTAASQADIITFHCPLTEQTKGIIGKELLSAMKPEAILINTSRGGAADEQALADALNAGKIAGAYLDVLVNEPMSPDTPLKSAKNCRITPHTAWAAFETRRRLMDIVCGNIRAWLDGNPVNKVN
ncbi:MAG: D-2-hydroxyacid dehydrogenase, partial [Ruminococcus sp.]|nr:D-2-hydroxyacid dehydrogenase [Ruminococcus sp.]